MVRDARLRRAPHHEGGSKDGGLLRVRAEHLNPRPPFAIPCRGSEVSGQTKNESWAALLITMKYNESTMKGGLQEPHLARSPHPEHERIFRRKPAPDLIRGG